MRKVKIPLMPKMKWLFRDNVDKKYKIRKIIALNALVVCLNIIYRLWDDILGLNGALCLILIYSVSHSFIIDFKYMKYLGYISVQCLNE